MRARQFGKLIGKKRVTIWLAKPVLDQVKLEAYRARVTQQYVLESLVHQRFDEQSIEDRDALLVRHLSRVRTQLDVIDREMEIVAECLGLFIRMWLTLNPPLPEEERDAAMRMAQQRYDQFIQALGKRIGCGQSMFTDLPREVVVKEKDFT